MLISSAASSWAHRTCTLRSRALSPARLLPQWCASSAARLFSATPNSVPSLEIPELVNKKVLAAFRHNLRPIVCVGQHLDQYESGQTEAVIHAQVQQSLAGIGSEDAPKLVIAYEPIWAIGTGKAATAEGAGQIIHYIRELYREMYGEKAARELRILYGGSVTSSNISEFIAQPDIDGALVGGASLKPDFVEIVRKTIEVMQRQQ